MEVAAQAPTRFRASWRVIAYKTLLVMVLAATAYHVLRQPDIGNYLDSRGRRTRGLLTVLPIFGVVAIVDALRAWFGYALELDFKKQILRCNRYTRRYSIPFQDITSVRVGVEYREPAVTIMTRHDPPTIPIRLERDQSPSDIERAVRTGIGLDPDSDGRRSP